MQVRGHLSVHVDAIGLERVAVHYLRHGCIVVIWDTLAVRDSIIYGILGLVNVQLPLLAVFILAAEVEHTIGDIA